jgi:hypothetical protein
MVRGGYADRTVCYRTRKVFDFDTFDSQKKTRKTRTVSHFVTHTKLLGSRLACYCSVGRLACLLMSHDFDNSKVP